MKSKKVRKSWSRSKFSFVKTNEITKKYEKVGQDQIMKKKNLVYKNLDIETTK